MAISFGSDVLPDVAGESVAGESKENGRMASPRLGASAKADDEPRELWKPFAIAGAVLIAVAGVATTCAGSGSANPAGGAAAGGTAVIDWYNGTAAMRQLIAADVAGVRTDLDKQDGNALRTGCGSLGDAVTEARAGARAPDAAAQALFDGGLDGYRDGVTACGHLFDGTRISVATLQQQVRDGLTRGDSQWSALATRLGQPMAVSSVAAPSAAAVAPAPTTAAPASAPASTAQRTPTPTPSRTVRPTAAATTAARTTSPPPPPSTQPPPVRTTSPPPPSSPPPSETPSSTASAGT